MAVLATFKEGSNFATAAGLWQWDYGQVLRIQGLQLPTAAEIHFSLNEIGGESVPRVGTTKDGVTDVEIPKPMLENEGATSNYSIYAFIYLVDDTSGKTVKKIIMPIIARPKPGKETVDTPEDRTIFREAIAEVNKSAVDARNAEKSAEAWAHGDHENYPERDEDNAKYYAEQAARIAAGIGNGGSGSISEDVIRQIISDFLQTNPPEEKDPTVSEWAKKDLGAGLTISEDGKLIVDTTDTVEEDNTKPVTSGAVYVVLGNVETLLSIL